MKSFVTFLLTLLVSISSFATLNTDPIYQAGWGNLSEAQKATIIAAVASASATGHENIKEDPRTTAKNVSEWVEIGSNVGKGLVGAAKELGVEVNKFAETPVGKLTIYLIVWKMMGGAIVHVVLAFSALIIAFIVAFFGVRSCREIDYGYEPVPLDGGEGKLKKVVKCIRHNDMTGFFLIVPAALGAFVFIMSLITI